MTILTLLLIWNQNIPFTIFLRQIKVQILIHVFLAYAILCSLFWTQPLIKLALHTQGGGGGVLRYISDKDVRSPILGLKFAI